MITVTRGIDLNRITSGIHVNMQRKLREGCTNRLWQEFTVVVGTLVHTWVVGSREGIVTDGMFLFGRCMLRSRVCD